MSRVYIAGPMTGIPLYNFPAFDAAAEAWRARNWSVVSPADLTREIWLQQCGREFDPASTDTSATDYRMFMRADLTAVMGVDALALLPGWEKSRGAALEIAVGNVFGKEFYHAESFEKIAPEVMVRVGLPTDETILQEAQRLVHGNRGADYGHPIEDYTRTGRIWGAILGIGDIDPRIACLMMAGVKISREVNKHKRDNLTDLAGYAECASMVAERQAAA